jgi:tripartite ATP-independent transporter DctP family solute receptor
MDIHRLIAATAVAASLIAGSVSAEVREHNLKLSHVLSPEFSKYNGTDRYVELVKQKSGGKINIKVYPGGTLGGDLQLISAMQGGVVDMAIMGPQSLAGVIKDVALFDLPYLFDNAEEARAVIAGPVGAKVWNKLPEKGLIGFPLGGLGFRHMHNSKHPITKLEDIKGLKIRVIQTPLYVDFVSALGANPTPLPFPELYSALEQKAVDGATNPVITMQTNKFYEVQKYFSLTRHMYAPQSLLISKKTWDKFNDDEKKVLTDAQKEAMDFRDKGDLVMDTFKKNIQINEISPQEIARMKEKAKPIVEKYAKEIPGDLVTEAQATVAKMRK